MRSSARRWVATPVVLAVVAFLAFAAASTAEADKPSIELSHTLYSFQDGRFVVDYTVDARGGGKADLAVHHVCFSGDELVYSRTNRVYWDDASQKQGSWNLSVTGGNECTAIVVDLNKTVSGDTSTLSGETSRWAAVSNSVSYTVE